MDFSMAGSTCSWADGRESCPEQSWGPLTVLKLMKEEDSKSSNVVCDRVSRKATAAQSLQHHSLQRILALKAKLNR